MRRKLRKEWEGNSVGFSMVSGRSRRVDAEDLPTLRTLSRDPSQESGWPNRKAWLHIFTQDHKYCMIQSFN